MTRSAKINSAFTFFLLLLNLSCPFRSSQPDVVYLIPEGFEGAVVIAYGRKNGIRPSLKEGSYSLEVPSSGILLVRSTRRELSGTPHFRWIGERKGVIEIEYLYRRPPNGSSGARTFDDLTKEERASGVFAMNYDQISRGPNDVHLMFRSFLICKVPNANKIASSELIDKIKKASGM